VGGRDSHGRRSEDRLRRDAAAWFARLRGPNAHLHAKDFDVWRAAQPGRQQAYDRLVRRWDEAAILALSNTGRGRQDIGAIHRRRLKPGAWALGGLLASAALVFGIYVTPVRPSLLDLWPTPSAWKERLATPVGEIRTVRLADGSSVTLDTNTVIRWRFSRLDRRFWLLQGRARFAVAHDAARPFIVSAGGGEVAAHGTLFDVSLTSPRSAAVTLLQGVVEVESAAGDGRGKRTRLSPGQELAFGRGLPAAWVRPLAQNVSTWPSGMLTFADTPLWQAVAEANRYSQTPIRLATPDLATLRVSGAYRAGGAHALANGLAAAFELQVRTDPDGAIVLEKASPVSAP
jgi:transmembrane sensor